MKNRVLVLVIGESIGLQCLKNFIKKNLFKISDVINTDPKYDLTVKKQCNFFGIRFHTSKQFKKIRKLLNLIKKKINIY